MSLSEMQKQKISSDLNLVPGGSAPSVPSTNNSTPVPGTASTVPSSSPHVTQAPKPEPQQQAVKRAPGGAKAVNSEQNSAAKKPGETVKLSDLQVPLSSIRPSPSIPPLTLPIESAAAETGKKNLGIYIDKLPKIRGCRQSAEMQTDTVQNFARVSEYIQNSRLSMCRNFSV